MDLTKSANLTDEEKNALCKNMNTQPDPNKQEPTVKVIKHLSFDSGKNSTPLISHQQSNCVGDVSSNKNNKRHSIQTDCLNQQQQPAFIKNNFFKI